MCLDEAAPAVALHFSHVLGFDLYDFTTDLESELAPSLGNPLQITG